MNQTPNRTGAAAAAAGDEPKVVIRPAGALPTGVRTSPSMTNAAANAAAQAIAKGRPKPKAKGKKAALKPAVPRQPLTQRLAARARELRFRLLPVTIFVAVLMLGVRVGDVWRLATHEARLPDFPVSLAESKTPRPPRQLAANGAEPAPPGGAAPAGTMAPAGAAGAAPAAGGAPAAGDAANGDLKPLGPVTNEELLKHFAERRAEIEKRTKELEQREALLTAAEKRIDQKVQEMDKVRADIQKMMRQGDDKQQAQIESLVTIYENMKPQDAARIFEKLDMPVLLDVIQKMKEKKTAPILAAMDPTKAKEVTAALIDRQSVPGSVTR